MDVSLLLLTSSTLRLRLLLLLLLMPMLPLLFFQQSLLWFLVFFLFLSLLLMLLVLEGKIAAKDVVRPTRDGEEDLLVDAVISYDPEADDPQQTGEVAYTQSEEITSLSKGSESDVPHREPSNGDGEEYGRAR